MQINTETTLYPPILVQPEIEDAEHANRRYEINRTICEIACCITGSACYFACSIAFGPLLGSVVYCGTKDPVWSVIFGIMTCCVICMVPGAPSSNYG